MEQLNLFYLFITFLTGVISLSIVTSIYIKTKDPLTEHYLGFYLTLTLLVVSNALRAYISTNIPMLNPAIYLSISYFAGSIVRPLAMFVIPVFIHYLCSVPQAKFKNSIFGGLAIIMSIEDLVFDFVYDDSLLEVVGDYTEDIVLTTIILYTFIVGLLYSRKLPDSVRKVLTVKFLILLGFYIPGIINDTFLSSFSPLEIFPILYCGFSVVFTHHFLKYSAHQTQITAHPSPELVTAETLFAQYNLSEIFGELNASNRNIVSIMIKHAFH